MFPSSSLRCKVCEEIFCCSQHRKQHELLKHSDRVFLPSTKIIEPVKKGTQLNGAKKTENQNAKSLPQNPRKRHHDEVNTTIVRAKPQFTKQRLRKYIMPKYRLKNAMKKYDTMPLISEGESHEGFFISELKGYKVEDDNVPNCTVEESKSKDSPGLVVFGTSTPNTEGTVKNEECGAVSLLADCTPTSSNQEMKNTAKILLKGNAVAIDECDKPRTIELETNSSLPGRTLSIIKKISAVELHNFGSCTPITLSDVIADSLSSKGSCTPTTSILPEDSKMSASTDMYQSAVTSVDSQCAKLLKRKVTFSGESSSYDTYHTAVEIPSSADLSTTTMKRHRVFSVTNTLRNAVYMIPGLSRYNEQHDTTPGRRSVNATPFMLLMKKKHKKKTNLKPNNSQFPTS